MLDERLSLAAELYEPCEWGADIGTDHAFLPCHLLRTDTCQHMIAADVSEKALSRARENLTRQRLIDRAEVVLADGLEAITRQCGCISVMGMGGELMGNILRKGQDKIQGAVLVLGAHTELHLVREAIRDIGYHIVQERLCKAAGRFYVFWRAEAGFEDLSSVDIRYGRLLWQEDCTLLREYAAWRRRVLQDKERGLLAATTPDKEAIREVQADITWYTARLEERTC
ncbi:MAG: SAM-dependent methyltransferase [Clostridiales bacterium]|nr:SAM-dependent methyltransferase [Clostridiales bacterium]